MRRGLRLVAIAVAAIIAVPGLATADPAIWKLLEGGGQVVLIRHAITTPGVGDPPGMRLEACA
ncbi:MAG TPA: histidine phosphatase family protein, partial [Candidatus Limnocylindria bacterium]|nr:histidine phosphatase family protein [Candidatus Limnocylindria bacterium]